MSQQLLLKKDSSLGNRVKTCDWECGEADTRNFTHGVHRYSGKFIPQIARQALEIISEPGEMVLDPYCGSGTTLLEATIAGRRAIGIDLNPLAVLISKVKFTPIPEVSLKALQRRLTEFVQLVKESQSGPDLLSGSNGYAIEERVKRDSRWQNDWYRKWFEEENLWQLIALHQEIVMIEPEPCRDLALVAFSDILRRCSHAHSGYPNVMYDKRRIERPLPSNLFLGKLDAFCKSITELRFDSSHITPQVFLGDARKLALKDESVDAIVTHPPYIGSIPYAEYGSLSLTWLGFDAKELDKRLTGGKRQSSDVVERFRADYGSMLHEAWRVLRPGRFCFLMVGSPLVKGKRINLRDMTTELGNDLGFHLAAETTRIGINRRANKMGEEYLLFLQKN